MNLEELRKANEELHKIIEDLKQDCYKCTCGLVTSCNCKHLGLRPRNSKPLTDLKDSDNIKSILKSLEF